ncbi:restriction endonuclease subunit S [Brachyspira hyodysenteriae]|uniref:restriction endonuclease subunit S n=1 Tax=Brachyspira hyodysenteriae TaxID=159 RepID=UPI002B25A098|nr:restriction endonuclease subunit S [Brachyspira hyodysenteriae]WPC36529.1 restriction endonuclease subunit S [Brachyspira hyodysenteriae]
MINNWEEKTLDEVCIKISAGGDKPQSFSKNKTDKFNIPVYANGTELNGLQGYTDKATITENAITISARGTIGFICKRLEPYCPIVRLISLIPRDYIYLDFLYYALHLMIYNSSGSSIPQLTVPQLKKNKIKYPSNIKEQKRIVEKLDNAFQKIESLENNTKENIKNIEDLYNSYLNKIFTENTDDWEEKTLDELCYILDSKRVPITKKYRNTGIYPYYGATGIQDYIDSYIFDETLLLVGEDGAKWGRCENTAFIVTGKFWVNNHAHVLKIKKDTIYEWLKYCLNYTDLSEYITGTTVPKLNQEKLKQIKVPIPKIEEQKKIVDKLDIFNNKIESIKQNYQNKLTLLEKLKKSILKKAFNGEL